MSNLYNPRAKSDRILHALIALFVLALVLMFAASAGWVLTSALIYVIATIGMGATLISLVASMITVMVVDDRRLYGATTYGI
jgi:membrane-associated PAP2 superfamily phosphatase